MNGEVLVEKQETKGPGVSSEVPDGMVHHWIGVIFIPSVTLTQVIPLVQDYDHRAELYKPDVVASHLISHQGNDYRFFLRLYQKRFTTVIFNTEYVTHWGKVDSGKMYSHSISTKIAELKDSDHPDGEEWPVGKGRGYLWRLNTYWRFEEKDGGVYMQCEALSLTRDIPFGLGWLLKPLVIKIPRESLNRAWGQTRTVILENDQKHGSFTEHSRKYFRFEKSGRRPISFSTPDHPDDWESLRQPSKYDLDWKHVHLAGASSAAVAYK
jgi:hypothetical protein